MNSIKKAVMFFLLSIVVSTTSFAAEQSQTQSSVANKVQSNETSPYKLLANVGNTLFSHIAALSPEARKNKAQMKKIVARDLMPYVDYRYASYKILGKYVKSATKAQRNEFVTVMRNYLESTYAQALTQYTDQQVKFELDKPVGNKRIVVVHTQIIQPNGGKNINIEFKFRKNRKTGQWRAFDMVVEGISLVSSKQAEITRQIREQGLDEVIKQLAAKNS